MEHIDTDTDQFVPVSARKSLVKDIDVFGHHADGGFIGVGDDEVIIDMHHCGGG